MGIPSFEQLMLPLLEYAHHGEIVSILDAEKYLAKKFELSEKDRQQEKPSGREPLFLHRLRWARTYLKRAGLISDPKLGHYKITDSGLNVLKQKPSTINTNFLLDFPDFLKWHEKIQDAKKESQKEKKIKDIPKKSGIVIFLDVLGTKGIWKKNNSSKILKDWASFTQILESQLQNIMRVTETLKFNTFSDTIIITVTTTTPLLTIMRLSPLLVNAILDSIMIGMPLRGCISTGQFFQDEKMVLGKAVDEAASYYELPQWIGISASPSVNLLLEKRYRNDPSFVEDHFFRCSIQLKNSVEQNGWAINWADISDWYVDEFSTHYGQKYDHTLQLLYEKMEETQNIIDALKWRNTIKFHEEVNASLVNP